MQISCIIVILKLRMVIFFNEDIVFGLYWATNSFAFRFCKKY